MSHPARMRTTDMGANAALTGAEGVRVEGTVRAQVATENEYVD